MKKITVLLLSLITVFSLTIPAFADVGEPSFRQYEVIVTNPSGAKDLYKENGVVVPYNTVLTVTMEQKDTETGTYTLYATNGKNYFSIKSSDVTKKQPNLELSDAVELDEPYVAIVANPEGVAIHTGPADSYDEAGTIPYGTVVASKYGDDERLAWIYVTYENLSGWLHIEMPYQDDCYEVVDGSDDNNWVETVDSKTYMIPENGDYDQRIYLPAGMRLYYRYRGFRSVLVEHNGVRGWLDPDDTLSLKGAQFGLVKPCLKGAIVRSRLGISLYEKPMQASQLQKAEPVGNIPFGKIVYLSKKTVVIEDEDSYNFTTWYAVLYNGEERWCIEQDKYMDVLEKRADGKTDTEYTIYSDPYYNEPIGKTDTDKKTFAFYSYKMDYSYIIAEDESYSGWVDATPEELGLSTDSKDSYNFDFADYSSSIRASITDIRHLKSSWIKTVQKAPLIGNDTGAPVKEIIKNSDGSNSDESNTDKTNITNPSKPAANKQMLNKPTIIIAVCTIAAVLVALTALVIIILLKKRNGDDGGNNGGGRAM